jgi:KUP system potassium uptake protein
LHLFTEHKVGALAVLAGVFLTVTGGEALYADMGHFGKSPIRAAWIVVVMPALVLNYFGQGALLIENPAAISQSLLFDGTIVVSVATYHPRDHGLVIGSQAVISGVFSVTTQAVSLGLLPRVRVEHSSAEHAGQIYVPTMNWLLMVASLALVIGFGSRRLWPAPMVSRCQAR